MGFLAIALNNTSGIVSLSTDSLSLNDRLRFVLESAPGPATPSAKRPNCHDTSL